MRVYTFSKARQNFATVLELAQTEGCMRITRRGDGVFNIQPASQAKSPFDIEGMLDLSRSEIVVRQPNQTEMSTKKEVEC